jgi:hypothetical protein
MILFIFINMKKIFLRKLILINYIFCFKINIFYINLGEKYYFNNIPKSINGFVWF